MVSPRSIDMYKPFLETFFSKSKFLYHSNAWSILWTDIYLYSVQGQGIKKVVNSQCNREGSDVSPRLILGNPVPNGRRGDRSVQDVCHVELANHTAFVEDHKSQTGLLSLVIEQIRNHRPSIDGISDTGS